MEVLVVDYPPRLIYTQVPKWTSHNCQFLIVCNQSNPCVIEATNLVKIHELRIDVLLVLKHPQILGIFCEKYSTYRMELFNLIWEA